MMQDFLLRTVSLIGEEAVKKLLSLKVAIFGVGGVGSFVAEALARAGVGNITLFDGDVVSATNLNRQIIALNSSIGKYKVQVMKERILDINPLAKVTANVCYFDDSNASKWNFSDYDYVIDAIDSVASKISIIVKAKNEDVKIISSMGAGNKLDPTRFKATDIYKTSVCPLARTMRKELRNRGIESLKVVYSDEMPTKGYVSNYIDTLKEKEKINKNFVPGSISFVPAAAGLIIASEVVRDVIMV